MFSSLRFAFLCLSLAFISCLRPTAHAEEPKAEPDHVYVSEATEKAAKESAKEGVDPYSIVIKDHHFIPETLTIPANKEVILTVTNEDDTPEEFESDSLRREKIIKPGSTAKIRLDPLEAGEYSYFGEFHEDTAKGKIIVK